MDYEETFDQLKFFVKTGIIVLSVLVLVVVGIRYLPSAIYVTSSATSTKLPIYSVDHKDKLVSLSFDLSGGNKDIEQILEILVLNDIKATFFVTGDWIAKYPNEVNAIVAAGHDLGNNSETHPNMLQLTKQEVIEEILKTHSKVKELTGIEMNLFRAPYGDYNNQLIDVANELDYYSIQWNIDSKDWKDYSSNYIINTVMNPETLVTGSIILLHNGTKYTVDALETLINSLKEEGYSLVPISQLIFTDQFYLDENGRQFTKD